MPALALFWLGLIQGIFDGCLGFESSSLEESSESLEQGALKNETLHQSLLGILTKMQTISWSMCCTLFDAILNLDYGFDAPKHLNQTCWCPKKVTTAQNFMAKIMQINEKTRLKLSQSLSTNGEKKCVVM